MFVNFATQEIGIVQMQCQCTYDIYTPNSTYLILVLN